MVSNIRSSLLIFWQVERRIGHRCSLSALASRNSTISTGFRCRTLHARDTSFSLAGTLISTPITVLAIFRQVSSEHNPSSPRNEARLRGIFLPDFLAHCPPHLSVLFVPRLVPLWTCYKLYTRARYLRYCKSFNAPVLSLNARRWIADESPSPSE